MRTSVTIRATVEIEHSPFEKGSKRLWRDDVPGEIMAIISDALKHREGVQRVHTELVQPVVPEGQAEPSSAQDAGAGEGAARQTDREGDAGVPLDGASSRRPPLFLPSDRQLRVYENPDWYTTCPRCFGQRAHLRNYAKDPRDVENCQTCGATGVVLEKP